MQVVRHHCIAQIISSNLAAVGQLSLTRYLEQLLDMRIGRWVCLVRKSSVQIVEAILDMCSKAKDILPPQMNVTV